MNQSKLILVHFRCSRGGGGGEKVVVALAAVWKRSAAGDECLDGGECQCQCSLVSPPCPLTALTGDNLTSLVHWRKGWKGQSQRCFGIFFRGGELFVRRGLIKAWHFATVWGCFLIFWLFQNTGSMMLAAGEVLMLAIVQELCICISVCICICISICISF